ncbi:MAG: hypothetical protein WBM58_16395 [Sedimenticolaceae bacterium]
MDDKLLKKYLKYANTDEAFAVLFVKKHLAEAKGHWVDIVDCRRYQMSPDSLHFKYVVGGLYKRKIKPQYPPKSVCTIDGKFDDRKYYLMTRAITWETAHKDIEQQKSKNAVPRKFRISGVSYDKNRRNKDFFRADAPPEIQALAKNLSDRTNPLWDKALKYANEPEFVYEVKKIHIKQDGA